jgi:hypothetical protein
MVLAQIAQQQSRAADVGCGSWLCENSEIEISDGKFVSSSSI